MKKITKVLSALLLSLLMLVCVACADSGKAVSAPQSVAEPANADEKVITEAGVYDEKTTYNNVIIQSEGVTLENAVVTGCVTIAKEVGEGNVTLKNSEVRGQLYIYGGGRNSIYLEGDTLVGDVYMKKEDSPVHLVIGPEASVQFVDVQAQSLLTVQGEMQNLLVDQTAAGTDIALETTAASTIKTMTPHISEVPLTKRFIVSSFHPGQILRGNLPRKQPVT